MMINFTRTSVDKVLLSLSIVLFISISTGMAQDVMKGSIYDETGSPVEQAVVNILELDSVTFIDYALTDAQGKWSAKVPDRDSFVLEFSKFGLGKVFQLITSPEQYAQPFAVRLKQEGFNLEAVTIEGEKIGVKQDGDTLTFDLGYFTTGAERTLGDVINRLPGMEIRDGSVYYGGEKITKLLVQGRDIINSNQKLATEGIRADQLKTIKIIENYKTDAQQFNTERSEDVAMDVRLKDSELDKWSGEVEVLGGYPHSVKGSVNAFKLGDKLGISTFVRANNVGEEVLNWSDIRGMLSGDRHGRRFVISNSSMTALLPSGLRISDRVQSNRDGIVNINLDYQPNDKLQVKAFAIAAYAERKSEVFTRTEYLSENITRTENMSSFSKTPIVSVVGKIDYQLDSLTFMSFSIPLSYNTASVDYNNTGKYGAKQFKTIRTSDDDNYLVLPSMLMRRKVGEKGQWRIDMRYDNTKVTGGNYFRDDFPFLALPIAGDSSYSILQNRTRLDQQLNVSTDLKLVKNDLFIQPLAEYSYTHNKLLLNADKVGIVDFDRDAELQQHAAVIGVKGGYESADWEIAPKISLNYYNRHFAIAGAHEEFFPGYELEVKRKFNRAHVVGFSGGYGLEYPSFNQVRSTYEIESATQLSTGMFPMDIAQKSYNTRLWYRNFNVMKELFMFGSVSYSYSDDVISGLRQQYPEYILSATTLVPFSQSFSSFLMFGKELDILPISIRPRLNYTWSEGFAARQDATFKVKNNFYRASLSIRSKWEFPLNVDLGFSYSYNSSIQENGRKTGFTSYTPRIELEYKVGGFKIETDFDYNFDRGGAESSELYIWDIEASYELKNLPLRFTIVADNILNLEPKEKLVNNFGLNANTFTRYMIFPGYIIGGVSWTF